MNNVSIFEKYTRDFNTYSRMTNSVGYQRAGKLKHFRLKIMFAVDNQTDWFADIICR